jgi:hypothetical protein
MIQDRSGAAGDGWQADTGPLIGPPVELCPRVIALSRGAIPGRETVVGLAGDGTAGAAEKIMQNQSDRALYGCGKNIIR